MESNIQPSFIPKKSLGQELVKPKRPFSFFSLIATVVFVVVVAVAVAAFGIKWYLNDQLGKKHDALQLELDNFNQGLVDDLSRTDSRIESSKGLLKAHLSPSLILAALGNATLKTVRFSNFNYIANPGQDASINMNGQAKSFMSVALQQANFLTPENQKYFKNPTLSDFSLDKDGNVTFSFSSLINPQFLTYGANLESAAITSPNTLKTSTSTAGAGSTTPSNPQ